MFYCENDNMFLPDRFVVGTCPKCGYDNANGDQCEKCDSLFSLNELKDAKCKVCGSPAKLKKSKHIFLNLSKGTEDLDKWIETKNMPAQKVGRQWKFKIDEVDAWIKSGQAAE